MNENKRSIRLLALIVATLFAMTTLFFAGSAANAWAQDPAGSKHITALKFSVLNYEFGQSPNGVQVGTSTENVTVQSKNFLQADQNADAWKDATGTFAPEFKYRVKIGFSATNGYDFNGLTKEQIELETGEKAVEYDAAHKLAIFELKRIPQNHTLTFNTNGGSNINPVTEPENTVIDLADYLPTKKGFKFAGWYADAALTQKMDEVALGQNITVYAKWTEDENAAPENPQPAQPGDSENQPAPAPNPAPKPKPSATNRGTASVATGSKAVKAAKKIPQGEAKTPVTGSHSLLAIPMSIAMTAAGAVLIASRRKKAIL